MGQIGASAILLIPIVYPSEENSLSPAAPDSHTWGLVRIGFTPGRAAHDAWDSACPGGRPTGADGTYVDSVFGKGSWLMPPTPFLPHYSSAALSRANTFRSSSVVVSPSVARPAAMSRNSRRMILPLRVLGNALVKRISSGTASAPICWRT